LRIVPNLPSVPVKPVVAQSDRAYAMFEHIGRFPWVLKVLEYQDVDHLLGAIEGEIIEPAEAMCQELAKR